MKKTHLDVTCLAVFSIKSKQNDKKTAIKLLIVILSERIQFKRDTFKGTWAIYYSSFQFKISHPYLSNINTEYIAMWLLIINKAHIHTHAMGMVTLSTSVNHTHTHTHTSPELESSSY